jgi:hypothetical protein
MARCSKLTAAVPIGLLLVATGCSSGTTSEQPNQTSPQSGRISATAPVGRSTPTTALPSGGALVELDPADFTFEITNRYWPMKPLTRWTYREVHDNGDVSEAVIVATTTTKRVANGVTARVVRDTVRRNGTIIEDTYDWYAQDKAGNIWYLGEDTAEFSRGKITSREGSFEAGVDSAQPGVIVPADPRPGMRYRQEHYSGHAEDNGEVLSIGEIVQAPTGRYRDALLTKDTTPLEPTVSEYKLYAPGVGPVVTLGTSGGIGREELIKLDRARPGDGTGPLGTPNG